MIEVLIKQSLLTPNWHFQQIIKWNSQQHKSIKKNLQQNRHRKAKDKSQRIIIQRKWHPKAKFQRHKNFKKKLQTKTKETHFLIKSTHISSKNCVNYPRVKIKKQKTNQSQSSKTETIQKNKSNPKESYQQNHHKQIKQITNQRAFRHENSIKTI